VSAASLRARPLRDATTLCLLGVPLDAVATHLALTSAERAALERVPRPAWSADPYRLPRLLQAALEASPGTAALLLARVPFARLCATVVASSALVELVRGSASIPDLVAPLVETHLSAAERDVWALEDAGRHDAPDAAAGQIQAACALVEAVAGAEQISADAARALTAGGFEALVRWAATEAPERTLQASPRGLVAVGRGAFRGRLERLEPPLAEVLAWLGAGRPEAEVIARLLDEDLNDTDARALLDEWAADGLISAPPLRGAR